MGAGRWSDNRLLRYTRDGRRKPLGALYTEAGGKEEPESYVVFVRISQHLRAAIRTKNARQSTPTAAHREKRREHSSWGCEILWLIRRALQRLCIRNVYIRIN